MQEAVGERVRDHKESILAATTPFLTLRAYDQNPVSSMQNKIERRHPSGQMHMRRLEEVLKT